MSSSYRNVIWVSPDGRDSNLGSETAPVRSIQQAVQMAEPGTTILVREGTYVENVRISASVNPDLKNLTADKPLSIVSVDGRGAAKIVGADPSGHESTVFTVGMSHMRIDGFEIVGNASRPLGAKDGGPLKIIGNADVTNPSTDVIVENNILSGTGVSMVKITKTADALIVNNSFEGEVHQNFIDMVTMWNSKVASNDFVGKAWLGVTMKTGSHNITVEHNYFDFENHSGKATQTAVLVGGVGYSQLQRDPLPSEFHFEASDIRVLENVIVSASDSAVTFQGGLNSVASGNVIANAGGTGFRSTISPSPEPHGGDSAGNTITDNILVGVPRLHEAYGTTAGYTDSGNRAGTLADADFAYGRGSYADEDSGVMLTVRAAGTGDAGTPPAFAVVVDGETVATVKVANPVGKFDPRNDSLYRDYLVRLDAEPTKVEIVFLNDGPGRDLFVDHILVGGTMLESEVDGFFRALNGNEKFAGAGEALYVNGALRFDLTPPEPPRNATPVIEMVSALAVDEGSRVDLAVSAFDPDGPAPSLSVVIVRDSDGSIVDPRLYDFAVTAGGKAVLEWSTREADDGRYMVVVAASDGKNTVTQTASLTVREVKHAPELALPSPVEAREGEAIAFEVRGLDRDGEAPALSMILKDAETGAVVHPALYRFVDNGDGTGEFFWRTTERHDGSYRAIVTADDGELSTSGSVDVTVAEVPVAINVRAGGVGTADMPPTFEVFADGVSLGIRRIAEPRRGDFDVRNDGLFKDFRFEVEGGTPDVIEIVFLNDGKSGSVQRDLVVDWVSVDGRVLESEVDGYFTQANGRTTFEGPREFLYVNGTLSFDGLADDALL